MTDVTSTGVEDGVQQQRNNGDVEHGGDTFAPLSFGGEGGAFHGVTTRRSSRASSLGGYLAVGGQDGANATAAAVHAAKTLNKPLSVDAQRIMAVLSDLQRKVSILDMLPEAVDKRMATIWGPELTGLIQEHRRLEERYRTLSDNRAPAAEIAVGGSTFSPLDE